MKATLKAIMNGVLNRLSKLASRTEENSNIIMNELYPYHNDSLAIVGINKNIFPTLKELWDNADKWEKNKK